MAGGSSRLNSHLILFARFDLLALFSVSGTMARASLLVMNPSFKAMSIQGLA